MNLQENIPVHIKRRTHLIDRVIHIMLQNMYPCDYNSSDHFVEGVLDEIRWVLLDVEELQGIERADIENYILDYKYDELTDYFNEHCIVLKNDNLQESIRKILKETNTEKMIGLVGQYMNAMYPDFKDGVVDVEELDRIDGRIWMEVYRKPNSEHVYAKYYNSKKELELDSEIANSLESMFNDDMTYVVEWFNNEFGADAEYVTYNI